MNLVPNVRTVVTRSAAIWIAFLFAALGILIHGLPTAPTFVKNALPVDNIIAGWDWLSGIATAIGVLLGRIVQQDSLTPGGP